MFSSLTTPEALSTLRSAHHVLAELTNPNTVARPSDIFYAATAAEVKLRKLIEEITPPPPCLHDDPPRVAVDGSCLRCGVSDADECREI